MLLKLDKPKLLSEVISIISELVNEVRIKVGKDGLNITAVDPANVALVSFNMPSTSFSLIEVEEEVIGINLDSLRSVLRRSGTGSSLVLQTDDNILKIEIQDKIKRTFNLATINIDTEEKSVPDLDFIASIEMLGGDFIDVIEDCSVVADSCSFEIKEGNFIVEAKGLNSAKSQFSGDEVTIKGDNSRSKFSLEYLKKFSRACKISEKVKISIANNYPIKVEFGDEKFSLVFVLAPRTEEE